MKNTKHTNLAPYDMWQVQISLRTVITTTRLQVINSFLLLSRPYYLLSTFNYRKFYGIELGSKGWLYIHSQHTQEELKTPLDLTLRTSARLPIAACKLCSLNRKNMYFPVRRTQSFTETLPGLTHLTAVKNKLLIFLTPYNLLKKMSRGTCPVRSRLRLLCYKNEMLEKL